MRSACTALLVPRQQGSNVNPYKEIIEQLCAIQGWLDACLCRHTKQHAMTPLCKSARQNVPT